MNGNSDGQLAVSRIWCLQSAMLRFGSHESITEPVALALITLSFAWAALSLWKVQRARRKLGWKPSDFTRFFWGRRPEDSDELVVWRWTLQFCYAILAFVFFVMVLVFMT
jgi:hypothetical protein